MKNEDTKKTRFIRPGFSVWPDNFITALLGDLENIGGFIFPPFIYHMAAPILLEHNRSLVPIIHFYHHIYGIYLKVWGGALIMSLFYTL